jgi:hypothetical protein
MGLTAMPRLVERWIQDLGPVCFGLFCCNYCITCPGAWQAEIFRKQENADLLQVAAFSFVFHIFSKFLTALITSVSSRLFCAVVCSQSIEQHQ